MLASRLLMASIFCVSVCAIGAHAQQQEGPPGMDRLHVDLHLSPTQDEAWRTFQQAYAVDPQEMARERNAAANMARMAAPQRVDMAIDMEKADLAAQERRGAALKVFYATLSPQQRQVFDRETLPPQGQE